MDAFNKKHARLLSGTADGEDSPFTCTPGMTSWSYWQSTSGLQCNTTATSPGSAPAASRHCFRRRRWQRRSARWGPRPRKTPKPHPLHWCFPPLQPGPLASWRQARSLSPKRATAAFSLRSIGRPHCRPCVLQTRSPEMLPGCTCPSPRRNASFPTRPTAGLTWMCGLPLLSRYASTSIWPCC